MRYAFQDELSEEGAQEAVQSLLFFSCHIYISSEKGQYS